MYTVYSNYQKVFFPKLLQDPKISPEDKIKIKELLQKPWNPYIRRHTGLTEKSKILKEGVLRAIVDGHKVQRCICAMSIISEMKQMNLY